MSRAWICERTQKTSDTNTLHDLSPYRRFLAVLRIDELLTIRDSECMPEADALHPLKQPKLCHPRESGGPRAPLPGWIPAFAGATVLFVKHGILLVGRNMVPSLLVAHHGIQDDEQFSHARSQSDLFLFASI